MAIKQITIFIENRAGRLLEITKLLAENKIDLRALNIAETTDYGLLRIIVDDTNKALNVLKENGAISTTTDVLAVAVPNVPGGLNTLLQVLATANVETSKAVTSADINDIIANVYKEAVKVNAGRVTIKAPSCIAEAKSKNKKSA